MSPAKIAYHVMQIVVSLVVCAGLAATTHHRDYFALALFICMAFSAVHSLGELRRDKP